MVWSPKSGPVSPLSWVTVSTLSHPSITMTTTSLRHRQLGLDGVLLVRSPRLFPRLFRTDSRGGHPSCLTCREATTTCLNPSRSRISSRFSSERVGRHRRKLAVFPVTDSYAVALGPDDAYTSSIDCDQVTDSDLPFSESAWSPRIPRVYFKTSGCNRDDGKDERFVLYRGQNRGTFRLGRPYAAYFDMGDIVTLKIQAVRTTSISIWSWHDVVNVESAAPSRLHTRWLTDDIARETGHRRRANRTRHLW